MNEISVSVDNDNVYDYSGSTDVGRETAIKKFWVKCRDKLTFKNLNHAQYRILIYISVFCNTLSLIVESCYLIQLKERHDFSDTHYSVIPFMVTILSALNVCLLLKLTQKPTTQATLGALGIMLFLVVAYITQACIHYVGAYKPVIEVTAVSIFIVIQFFSAVMLYRFWELILYNYDESTVGSVRNSLVSNEGTILDGSHNIIVGAHSGGALSGGAIGGSSKNTNSNQLRKALTSAAHMLDSPVGNDDEGERHSDVV